MKKEIKVEIPSTPNFIKVGEVVVSIEDFTDEELKELGKEWTEDLLKKAQKKRNFLTHLLI